MIIEKSTTFQQQHYETTPYTWFRRQQTLNCFRMDHTYTCTRQTASKIRLFWTRCQMSEKKQEFHNEHNWHGLKLLFDGLVQNVLPVLLSWIKIQSRRWLSIRKNTMTDVFDPGRTVSRNFSWTAVLQRSKIILIRPNITSVDVVRSHESIKSRRIHARIRVKNERSERSDSENRYVSSTFTVLSTENINLRYTDSTRFVFIKILNILSELHKIVKKETVRIAYRNVDVLHKLNSVYELW